MKLVQSTELQQHLKQDTASANTIVLHKCENGWVAFENSALLLQHYFAPVWLRMVVVGAKKIPYVLWQGAISPRKSSEVRAFEFSCADPEQMIIRCPEPLKCKI